VIISNHLFTRPVPDLGGCQKCCWQGHPVVGLDDGSTDDTIKLGAIGDISL
jgi:hypothetical protein